ncbi:hypothetical protein D918_10120 [Trichuris suis]|nr:hypothetical protein D918_10120 [Trichuris suis]
MYLKAPPLLVAPDLSKEFQLCTDASEHGIGAVLEQEGRVVAYASRALRPAEKNYSVIEKECLAIVFATKKFRHFLLGSKFRVLTDHAPLQWLAAQKMEGRLTRWAVMLQEFDMVIAYRPGQSNGNADALSRSPIQDQTAAAVGVWPELTNENLANAQRQDTTIRRVIEELVSNDDGRQTATEEWKKAPLARFLHLRKQLHMHDGVLRRKQVSSAREMTSVPVIPSSLKVKVLEISHNIPAAGHLGCLKTLENAKSSQYFASFLNSLVVLLPDSSSCALQPVCYFGDSCLRLHDPRAS